MALTQAQIDALSGAVGQAWAAYKCRHPQLAAIIEQETADPTVPIMQGLSADAEFQALMAKTDSETNVANIVKVVLPVVMQIVTSLIK